MRIACWLLLVSCGLSPSNVECRVVHESTTYDTRPIVLDLSTPHDALQLCRIVRNRFEILAPYAGYRGRVRILHSQILTVISFDSQFSLGRCRISLSACDRMASCILLDNRVKSKHCLLRAVAFQFIGYQDHGLSNNSQAT